MRLNPYAITTALLMTGALAAGSAHAGANLEWQIRVETPVLRLPGHVVLPLPPIPVPHAVVVNPPRHPQAAMGGRGWDADGDGIPNRRDRVYNPRWDRDGDGIPNRHDARPNDPRNGRHGWAHDHDRHDRHDRRDERPGHGR